MRERTPKQILGLKPRDAYGYLILNWKVAAVAYLGMSCRVVVGVNFDAASPLTELFRRTQSRSKQGDDTETAASGT